MTAPAHPLAENLELPLPNRSLASIEEIRAVQLRDRIPGVVKRIVPLDDNSFWEYWWCVPHRLLLPEDAELLQSDRPRVEAIVAKLVWLWGGLCFSESTCREGDCSLIYDWQQVLTFVQQQGIQVDLLDIDYLPMAIEPHSGYIQVEPSHWHVEFFQLQPTTGGYELPERKQACSCQVWTGKPFIKNLETGAATTKYDLWVSQPLNLTIPLW
jgi:hypothetical protein